MIPPNEENAFWRYADWLKFSAIVAAVEQFSTRQPTHDTVTKMFRILGVELNSLIKADKVYHLFLNPDLNETHILLCQEKEEYCRKDANIRILLDENDPLLWFYYKDGTIQVINDCCELVRTPSESDELLWNLLEKPPFYAIAPFCQRDIPLGYFVFAWGNSENLPELFKREGVRIRESAVTTLNYLQGLVTRLFINHYPLYRDTYLPKFMEPFPKHVAILFADIRNFTSTFEAMRLYIPGNVNIQNPLVGLVKAYLTSASQIIAQSGIGRIDKFIGDGIMTIFGEYLCCKTTDGHTSEENQHHVACLLALYSAVMLIDAFEKLFKHFRELDTIEKFMMEYNERFDLRVGVGINFGDTTFDYFGTSIVSDKESSRLIGGYLEFTAIGDNVNTAQRLESMANKPVTEVSIIERSEHCMRRNPAYTSPIIMSRTAFLRIRSGIKRPSDDSTNLLLSDYYKSAVKLEGKGSVVEIYEINPIEVNGDYLLRTLSLVGLERIANFIKPCWKENEGRFRFPDE